MTDDFVELGADSLHYEELLSEIEEVFHRSLPASTFLEETTPQRIASLLRSDDNRAAGVGIGEPLAMGDRKTADSAEGTATLAHVRILAGADMLVQSAQAVAAASARRSDVNPVASALRGRPLTRRSSSSLRRSGMNRVSGINSFACLPTG